MTPAVVVNFMAEMLRKNITQHSDETGGKNLLDCGAGIGTLAIAATQSGINFKNIEQWEIDPIMRGYLTVNMQKLNIPYVLHNVPDSDLVYVGDTGDKNGYFDTSLLKNLGVELDTHGKLPDVVIYDEKRNWLILIESVTTHGPVDSKRHLELTNLFKTCKAGLVFVSAFPTKKVVTKYMAEISWETEVWVPEAPTHMIHFNGVRFLGPYK